MKATSLLLLLFSLPTNRNTERVAVWRRLKKMGAVQIKTSTYLLPDEPAQYEQFQWLAKQIRDYGGDSTLVRAQEIEGLTREEVVSLFDTARDKAYVDLKKQLQSFLSRRRGFPNSSIPRQKSSSRQLPKPCRKPFRSTCWTPNSRITAIAARLRRLRSVFPFLIKPLPKSAK